VVGIPDVNTGGGQPTFVPSPGNGGILPSRPDAQPTDSQDFRNLRISSTTTNRPDRPDDAGRLNVGDDGENDAVGVRQNTAVDLGRIAWLGTVLACLIAVLILVVQGYYGYAAVTFAVALAAAINLL
jgi:hypothetical protein